MNEREALKRATEALKAIDLTGIKHQEKPVEAVGRIRGIACDALKDIEAVLAQPEQLGGLWIDGVAMKPSDMEAIAKTWMAAQPKQEPVAWMKDVGHGKYVDMVKPVGGFYGMCIPLYTHPPQPEQEPVAWMHNHIKGNVIAHRPADIDRHPEHWTALYPEPKPCPTCEALARTVMLDQTSHDTAPPQRTWVGLTDEEKSDIWYVVTNRYFVTEDTHVYADAIEAKLKAKNFASSEGFKE